MTCSTECKGGGAANKNLWDDYIVQNYNDDFLENYQDEHPTEYSLFKEFTSGIDITNIRNPSELLDNVDFAAQIAFDGWVREKGNSTATGIIGSLGDTVTDPKIPQTGGGKAGLKAAYDLTSGIVINQKQFQNHARLWLNGPTYISKHTAMNDMLEAGYSKRDIQAVQKMSRNYWKPKVTSKKR